MTDISKTSNVELIPTWSSRATKVSKTYTKEDVIKAYEAGKHVGVTDYKLTTKNRCVKKNNTEECRICFAEEYDTTCCLVPCGHFFCEDCIITWDKKTCPLCRTIIFTSVKLH